MNILIGNKIINIKDYYCAVEDCDYLPKQDGKLWMYIYLTNECNASCPFCVSKCSVKKIKPSNIDLGYLEICLNTISEHIHGVSITGGEPMLYPELVDATAKLVVKKIPNIILDLVTNGTNLEHIPKLHMIDYFEAIHISRHSTDDMVNNTIFGRKMPSSKDIQNLISKLSDRQKIVFNCVLQKGLVENDSLIKEYLEYAANVGVDNTSFIGMFQANDYCKEKYISPKDLELKDSRFHIWNNFHDYEFCSCSSGNYIANNGSVRYYYRCPGSKSAPFARQLVYTADNKLLAGFGGEEIYYIAD